MKLEVNARRERGELDDLANVRGTTEREPANESWRTKISPPRSSIWASRGAAVTCGCRKLGATVCGSGLARSVDDRLRHLLDAPAARGAAGSASPIGRREGGGDPGAAPRACGT